MLPWTIINWYHKDDCLSFLVLKGKWNKLVIAQAPTEKKFFYNVLDQLVDQFPDWYASFWHNFGLVNPCIKMNRGRIWNLGKTLKTPKNKEAFLVEKTWQIWILIVSVNVQPGIGNVVRQVQEQDLSLKQKEIVISYNNIVTLVNEAKTKYLVVGGVSLKTDPEVYNVRCWVLKRQNNLNVWVK